MAFLPPMKKPVRAAMFPPFEISLFADPAGSFTTAAAMVARVEKELKSGWSGRRVSVFGGTGVVGFSAAVIAALEGAKVTLIGYDGAERVRKLADAAKARFNVDIAAADGSSDALKTAAVAQADVVLCAGRAGVEIIGAAHLKGARDLKVVADVNAVPPSGIAGLGPQDDGKKLAGTGAVGIGPFAIGGIKYRVQFGLLQKMTTSDMALCLDFRDAYRLARELAR
jgi:methylene-tetrahydromethanopterin dehydrogenase